MKGFPGLTKN